jgi:hypothetical protein
MSLATGAAYVEPNPIFSITIDMANFGLDIGAKAVKIA